MIKIDDVSDEKWGTVNPLNKKLVEEFLACAAKLDSTFSAGLSRLSRRSVRLLTPDVLMPQLQTRTVARDLSRFSRVISAQRGECDRD